MATYSIRAPDGRTYQIQGPEGASQEDVQAEVLRQHPGAAGQPAAPRASGRSGLWDGARPRGRVAGDVRASITRAREQGDPVERNLMRYRGLPADQAQQSYRTAREAIARRFTDPAARERALQRFDTDPRIQAVRQVAGLAPVTSRRQELQETARAARSFQVDEAGRRDSQQSGNPLGFSGTGLGRAFRGGTLRSMFGVPERAMAAGTRFLPTAITGNDTDMSYDEVLQRTRARSDADMDQSTTGNVLGQITGSLASGFGVGGLVARGAGALARVASPIASRVGNILQNLTTLQRGQPVRNALRVSGAGAAGGGAQAAGEGSDVSTGVWTGALAAPVVHGVIRGSVGTARAVRAGLGRRSGDRVLRSIIQSPPDVIQARAAELRRITGAEPTIYEALPLQDKQAFDAAVAQMPAGPRERLQAAVRGRAQNMVRETADRATAIVGPRANALTDEIALDLARSRGDTVPNAAETALARRAARSPLDMEEVADTEARNIMAPHDATVAYPGVADLLPQHPTMTGSTVTMTAHDPDVAQLIQNEAGLLRISDQPVTVRDITTIMSNLSKYANRSSTDQIQRGVAERAIQHLETILARDHPAVLPAVQQMRSAFAARMRMMEGFSEGGRTRLRENVDPATPGASREARNAYDTSEGTSGRTLGQSSRLQQDILTSPGSALRSLDDLATNPTAQEAISRNLGPNEAAALTELAGAQTQSARRLGNLASEQLGAEDGPDMVRMMQGLLMLSPTTLPATKAQGVIRLIGQFTRMPERAANRVVDMLFSQNPAQISQAIRILSNTGQGGRRVLRDLAISVGQLAGGGPATPAAEESPAAVPSVADDLGETELVAENAETEDGIERPQVEEDSPYAAELQAIYDNESPEMLDLIRRVENQESGGQQFGPDGRPLASSAGAIGVMQVMPGTAPEAARLAGLPYDEDAYYSDPVYNRIIGIAYLSEQLRRFDGNVELALAAYNAGPGRAEAYGAGRSGLPAETVDYIERIGA